MLLAAVMFSSRDWLIPGALFSAAVLLLLVWSYRNAPGSPGHRALCLGLKLLGVLALALCLLEPIWSRERARPGSNFFAVLADNSQGMKIKDRSAKLSRGENLQVLLTGDKQPWQPKLDENFQLRRYLFDARLQSTRDFSELAFDGRVSSMISALRNLADRYKGQPLAGVLLLTDGNATDLGEGLPDLSGLPPVYPVVMGTDDAVQDVALQRVAVSQTSFEDAPVTLQAEASATGYPGETLVAQLIKVGHLASVTNALAAPVAPVATNTSRRARAAAKTNAPVKAPVVTLQAEASATGYPGETLVAQLIKVGHLASVTNTLTAPVAPLATNTSRRARAAAKTNAPVKAPVVTPVIPADKMVAEQRQRAADDGAPASFRFQFKPDQSGLAFYRLQVSAKEALDAGTNSAAASEATLANNSRVVVVDRGRGPYRILYVAGRPNWEYKFLQRAVIEDDQVQLVGLIRIANREPKFEFRGRAGESSNPLFRGFGNQSKEEIERYDQPVLIRMNTKDQQELAGGFPKLPEDLFGYHAIILDDLEAGFFTTDQLSLLQKFVSERGGGLLMLGGSESFQEGKFNRTPVGDMLPVYVDGPVATAEMPTNNLRISLTREGWLQPWVRLRANESDERSRLSDVPPFGVLNKVRGIKPGASVIATVTDGRDQFPALAVQRFGNGRVGAMLVGDVWRWGFRDEASQKDMAKAWRQTMRWLVADVPQRTELTAEPKAGDPNQAIRLQVKVRDKKFLPLDNATITLQVRPVGAGATNVARLTAEASATQAGVYEATYVPRETGGYHAEAMVVDANGMEVGRAEAGWTSDPASDEFRSLKPNRALLEAIAKGTGGEIVLATKLEEFAKNLPNKKAPITEAWTSPLWHQAGVFLFALACFVAEWGLRRRRGMA